MLVAAKQATWWLEGFAFSASACATTAVFGGWIGLVRCSQHAMARPASVVLLAPAIGIGCAVLAALASGALGFAPAAALPRLSRLSPNAGLQRLASGANLVAALWCAAVVVLLAAVCAPPMFAAIADAAHAAEGAGLAGALHGGKILWARMVGVLLPSGLLEVAFARRRFNASIRMTARELKEERAQTEIRPEAKQRRRTLGARRARSLRLTAIRKATAVVTNPQHVAVALRYAPPEIDVPVVVARGADLTARIVRSVAADCDIPVIESPDLARLLYANVEVDEPIPEECYAAVAAVFAWIIRTRGSLRTTDAIDE
jgi:flagellar biosynthetic protein FlhB